MEAARVAALRGHDVTLYEKADELGGQVRIAAKVPNREEFGEIVRHLAVQVKKAGAKVVLGTEVSDDDVLSARPDAVIVATGSTPLSSELPGADASHVLNIWDVIQENAPVGQQVVVVDGGEASWQCYSTIEFLLGKGKQVSLITRLNSIGVDIPTHSLPTLHRRLFSKGLSVYLYTDVTEIGQRSVKCVNRYSDKKSEVPSDTVVVAIGNRASNELYKALKGNVLALHAVGDCLAPRKVSEAIREGHMAGRRV